MSSGGSERVGLTFGMLIGGGDPSVADVRHSDHVTQTSLPLPRFRTRVVLLARRAGLPAFMSDSSEALAPPPAAPSAFLYRSEF
jgi:hypothetical protein